MQVLLQGYGYSGVSFLRDFFKEVNDTYVFNDEFDLMRKSGGIFESFNVLSENNPFLEDCVIRNFINFYNYLYHNRNWKDVLGSDFEKISAELVNSMVLTKKEWPEKGYQVQNSIKLPKDKYRIHKKYASMVKKLNNDKDIYFLKTFTKEQIEKILFDYTQKILNLFPKSKYLCLVHPLQISSYFDNQLKFFDEDSKIIIISRDPRDVFVDYDLIRDVRYFVEYFKKWHLASSYNYKKYQNKMLIINFEDFVLNYDKVEKQILDFCGINPTEHVRRKELSNPEISRKNVGLYRIYKNQDEIKYIEKELKEYLYTGQI